MPWGPEDWDAWALRATDEEDAPPSPEVAWVREILAAVPGRRRLTVADLGCGRGAWLPFLAESFGSVVALDYAPASLAIARRQPVKGRVAFRRRDLRDLTPFRDRFHVALALESIVGPRLADVDRMLEQVRASLVEGGLLVAAFPARAKRPGLVPMRLRNGEGADAGPLEFTEIDVQYRLHRAGFHGLRRRRFARPDGRSDVLVCAASRRASN